MSGRQVQTQARLGVGVAKGRHKATERPARRRRSRQLALKATLASSRPRNSDCRWLVTSYMTGGNFQKKAFFRRTLARMNHGFSLERMEPGPHFQTRSC